MTHLFLDTDILLDFIGDRKPFSKYAAQVFLNAHNGVFRLYTSGNSVTTAYYILCKSCDEKTARKLVVGLMEYIHIIPVTSKILQQALNSDFKDFEDSVQHFCALTDEKISYIITRNLRDYRKSQLKAISPEQLFTENK